MSVEAYRDLVEQLLRGTIDPASFREAYAALPPAPPPYGYANTFLRIMESAQTSGPEFRRWLAAAVPYLAAELARQPDEHAIAERLREFWTDDGYFEPATAGRFRDSPRRAWDGALPGASAPLYAAFILDPDNALSTLDAVVRFTPDVDLTPHVAPQGGMTHVVLVPADFTWLLHHAYDAERISTLFGPI